jgi:hypothetical protein
VPSVVVDHPAPGAEVGGPSSLFLAGRVAASFERGERLDLVLAIDTSRSACRAPDAPASPGDESCAAPGSGSGETPGRLLDVELAGARALLARLDPGLTRVGVVSVGVPVVRALHRFSGPDTGFLGTRLELAPTQDLAQREPDGPTNLAGALGRATSALLAQPDPAPRRAVVLLTDGLPTAPRETLRENLVECFRAADRAGRRGVRVLAFALGEAAREPLAALEIADRTGGALYPIPEVADLPGLLESVQLDQIGSLAVRNLTTGADALYDRLGADGSWDALVPVAPGPNRLEVAVRTEAGAEARSEIDVVFSPDAAAPEAPAGLAARRAAARAAELEIVTSRVAALEREAAARTRARLAERIAREREAARSAAEAGRRELALEIEPPAVGAGAR